MLVGDGAKRRRFIDGVNTVSGAKRLMGRTWGSTELNELRKRLPYELQEGKNKTLRSRCPRSELYTIPGAQRVRAPQGEGVGRRRRSGTRSGQGRHPGPGEISTSFSARRQLAGELAGLEVVRVLNEPTAAALAYGHVAATAKDEQIAVYDFGGGTFDLTMLSMSERELRVRATAGDMFLGGDDVDLAIAGKIADAYLKKHHYDPRADSEVYARIRVDRRADQGRPLGRAEEVDESR